MSLTAPVISVLFFVAVAQGVEIHSGVFKGDNITRFLAGSPECSGNRRSIENYEEQNRDCCYQKKTKDQCCIEELGNESASTRRLKCKCDPNIASECQAPTGKTEDNQGQVTGTEKSLCHDSKRFRLLNSDPVSDKCTYAGIIAIKETLTNKTICNAVYTTVEFSTGKVKALVTSKKCMDTIVLNTIHLEVSGYAIVAEGVIEVLTDPGDLADATAQGLTYYTIKPLFENIFSRDICFIPTCVYSVSMFDNIEFGKCKMISYGATGRSDRNTTTKLREVDIFVNPFGCNKVTFPTFVPTPTQTWACFRLPKNSLIQEGDGGAAVYCTAKSNNEDILVGIAEEVYKDDVINVDVATSNGDHVPVLMLKYKVPHQ